jgi:hypothetical protein
MKNKTLMFLCLSLFVFNFQIFAQKKEKPEKVKAVKTINGKFVSFEIGDYTHLSIKKTNGKIKFLWLGNSWGLDYFLAEYKGKPMSFTYEIVDTFIPEAGKNDTIERLESAKVGKLSFESWIKQLKRKYTFKQIEKRYQSLVDKYSKIH